MAYFRIDEPNKPQKWIKDVDRANGTLEFSEVRNGCYQRDSGFFADSELEYLKFHFTDEYPEMEYCVIDGNYNRIDDVGGPVAEPVAAQADNGDIALEPFDYVEDGDNEAEPW
jgi:hypothetical protein